MPGAGWLFRVGVGWKYLIVLALSLPPLLLGRWWLTVLGLVVVLVIFKSSGISVRRALDLGWVLWLLLAILAVYQAITLRPEQIIVQPGNILLAVLAARLLTLTSSIDDLMVALTRFLGFTRWFGVDPDKISLAVALMIRSVPYLVGALDDARDAARCRGLSRNPLRLLLPFVLGAVAYAEGTAEALSARGIGEPVESKAADGQSGH